MREDNLKLVRAILQRNGINSEAKAEAIEAGQTNNIYAVGSYIIRVDSEIERVKGLYNHQLELVPKLLSAGAKVPRIIDQGFVAGREYMLVERLPGQNLAGQWFTFSEQQKENFIVQIVEQLKVYHQIKFNQYSLDLHRGKYFDNYQKSVLEIMDFFRPDIDKLDHETRARVELTQDFADGNLGIIDETGTAVLVHGDIQFENVIFQGDGITGIIDFDLVSWAPRDHEIGKTVDFFLYPKNYVARSLEKYYINNQLIKEWGYYKKHYPEMFETANLLPRLKYYYVVYMFWLIKECQAERWSDIPKVLAETRDKIDYIFEDGGKFDNFIMN